MILEKQEFPAWSKEAKRIASAKCRICNQPIGYKKEFFSYQERYFHKDCVKGGVMWKSDKK